MDAAKNSDKEMKSQSLVITDEIVTGFMRGFNLVPPLYRYTSIEDSAARMLANSNVNLDLDGVCIISITAINYLVERQDDICLGIRELADDAAEALTKFCNKLSLNDLSSISLSSLRILLSTPRELLSLDGLMYLTPEQAALLANFQGGLSLGGLTRLDEEIAEHLSLHVGALSLANLKAVTTEEARHLVNHQGTITLNATLKLPREGAYLLRRRFELQVNAYSQEWYLEDCLAAGTDSAIATARDILATLPKTLFLDSLYALTLSGAEVLAQFAGDLHLPALEEIDPRIAVLLAQHNGPSLALDGLKSLTAPVAEALGKHHGALSLRGILLFDEGCPGLLALHDGPLTLPLPDGGNDKFGWFKSDWNKILWKPSGIEHHDMVIVEEILKSNSEKIEIPEEVHFVSNTVLARLGYACRALCMKISLPGILQINQEQCHLLTGNHIERKHANLNGSLALDGLLELSDPVAEELGKSGLSLSLSNLSDVASGALRRLTQDIKDLTLRLTSLDKERCEYLITVPGQLCIEGIKLLPAGCAAILSGYKGRFTLNGLEVISEEDARELARREGTVELMGIRSKQINSALLEAFISRAIVLNDLEVFYLICEVGKFLGNGRSRDPRNCAKGSGSVDSTMHELIVRVLIEHFLSSLFMVEQFPTVSSRVLPGNELEAPPERQALDKLARMSIHRRSLPYMSVDDLISYVTKKFFDREDIEDGDENSLSFMHEKRMFKQYDRQNEIFFSFFGIAGTKQFEYLYNIERHCPGFKPIMEACFLTANRILCAGITGESNISCNTLVVLGCLYGNCLDLPEVNRLCINGAKALSVMEAELVLNGIEEISTECALLLSKHEGYSYTVDFGNDYRTIYEGSIEMSGIQHIDDDTAAALALHRGNNLCLNGLMSLSPRAAQSLSGCLDRDPWVLVDGNQVEAHFAEVILDFQEGGVEQVGCVLNAFINLTILLSRQDRASDLEVCYVALRDSLASKYGKASKPWVSCVVHAARARANGEFSSTQLILQETQPVIESLIIATDVEEESDLRFIEWVAETGESDVAHTLLEKVKGCRRRSQLIIDGIAVHDNLI